MLPLSMRSSFDFHRQTELTINTRLSTRLISSNTAKLHADIQMEIRVRKTIALFVLICLVIIQPNPFCTITSFHRAAKSPPKKNDFAIHFARCPLCDYLFCRGAAPRRIIKSTFASFASVKLQTSMRMASHRANAERMRKRVETKGELIKSSRV